MAKKSDNDFLGMVVSNVESAYPKQITGESQRMILSSVASAFLLRECSVIHEVGDFSINLSGIAVLDSHGIPNPAGSWTVSVQNSGVVPLQSSMEEMNEALQESVNLFAVDFPSTDDRCWELVESNTSSLSLVTSDSEKGCLVCSAVNVFLGRARENDIDLASLLKEAATALVNCAISAGQNEMTIMLDKHVSIMVKKMSASMVGPGVSLH